MAKLNNNYHKIKFSIYVKTLLIWMILCFVLFSIIGAIVSVPMGKKTHIHFYSTLRKILVVIFI